MANYQLTVEERTQTGKSYARQLRANEKLPAVIYGSGKGSTPIEVGVRDVEKALAAHGSLIDLNLGGTIRTVLVKDLHRDPVRGTLQHLDFHEIDLTKKLEITVPIRVVGEDLRPSDGGVVQTLLWEVEVLCLPTDIPEFIAVDVSGVQLEHTVNVEDLELPPGVEVLADLDEAVVKVGAIAEVDLGEDDELEEGEAGGDILEDEEATESAEAEETEE
ncbi:MAG TPA: 50S ribosomal protein L25 [Firmicutes bacterium]|nr:50S ribosomal protein L25 [Bacillota bacterium]